MRSYQPSFQKHSFVTRGHSELVFISTAPDRTDRQEMLAVTSHNNQSEKQLNGIDNLHLESYSNLSIPTILTESHGRTIKNKVRSIYALLN